MVAFGRLVGVYRVQYWSCRWSVLALPGSKKEVKNATKVRLVTYISDWLLGVDGVDPRYSLICYVRL